MQFEILPKPPHLRAPDNPWPQWPKVYRLDYGQEEVAAVFGQDPRTYCVMSKRFVGDAEGHVRGVESMEIEWASNNGGGSMPREIPGKAREWPTQMILLAMGFLGPETDGLLSQLSVGIDERGNVRIDEDKMTSVPGVFAAGDMARGQSLVVWAIADGRRAATADGRRRGAGVLYVGHRHAQPHADRRRGGAAAVRRHDASPGTRLTDPRRVEPTSR